MGIIETGNFWTGLSNRAIITQNQLRNLKSKEKLFWNRVADLDFSENGTKKDLHYPSTNKEFGNLRRRSHFFENPCNLDHDSIKYHLFPNNFQQNF